MRNKRQHSIPSSYLKAWCDPDTVPIGGEYSPYVWIFSKDGKQVEHKPPEKIFFEKDLYTVHTKDGERNLTIEQNLSRLEGEFSRLRKNKLEKKIPLSQKDHLLLCMFVAAMYGRTVAQADHWRTFWRDSGDLLAKAQRVWEEATPEKRAGIELAFGGALDDNAPVLSEEDINELESQPFDPMLEVLITRVAPILFRFPYIILETLDEIGFITSDNPCVSFDPFGLGGFGSPTIEITLPLSPKQMLFISRELDTKGMYFEVKNQMFIDAMNHRTKLHANKNFVSNRGELRFAWFK